ncbi:MAG: ethanolamine ammonia-lyase subunit EutC [Acidobacteriota bacterium]|nr:ethanolamine ammonia-lyase subunit EutC [Acidobacteriota bacterium]
MKQEPDQSGLVQQAEELIALRRFTPARVGLGRTGTSITTRHALEFSLAHAQARDAVYSALAVPSLLASLRERGIAAVVVRSAAADRTEYVRRPDLGRRLADVAAKLLSAGSPKTKPSLDAAKTISILLADGLSALAVERHALPVLDALLPLLKVGEADSTWRLAPVVVAEQARVALGDEIGHALNADVTVVLIGERPGLSSPDSLGAYITWSPRPGRTDAERNCISNIRSEGLDYSSAAAKISWYITEGRRLGLSGVQIRESGKAIGPSILHDTADM